MGGEGGMGDELEGETGEGGGSEREWDREGAIDGKRRVGGGEVNWRERASGWRGKERDGRGRSTTETGEIMRNGVERQRKRKNK